MADLTASSSLAEKGVMETVLSKLGNKLVSLSVDELQKLVHKSSEASVSNFIEPKGFSKLNINVNFTNLKGIKDLTALRKVLDRFGDNVFKRVAVHHQPLVLDAMTAILGVVEGDTEEGDLVRFNLCFENGVGSFLALNLNISQRKDGKYNLSYGDTYGSFMKAPAMMVVQKSKKGFFKSKSWLEMVPLTPEITKDDLQVLLSTIFPAIANWSSQISQSGINAIDE
jgi:hypothetical protein